ncbi:DEAD-box ATP-dependent RNA helicase 38 [Tanacetum coccineum]|uniref:RNA helicase n=1 Tax=Tanacetum coccineum TaxID=301880 RepID=A0ABQ5DUE0_9ASTR
MKTLRTRIQRNRAQNDSLMADELNLDSLTIDESKKINKVDDDQEDDSNVHAVTSGDTPYTSAVRFEDLNISDELLKGLYVAMKYERPSKIQSITLPMILSPPYKSLIAQAHNGSGKTTCFVLGMLSRIDPKLAAPQAICICPTRELAIQNMEVLQKMGKFSGITSELAIRENLLAYKRAPVTAQVVIGTPDHMLAESGFRPNTVKIMNDIVKQHRDCQVLLFSATFNEKVKAFALEIVTKFSVKEYNQLYVKKEELSLDSVKQYKVKVPDELAKIMVIKDKIMFLAQKVGQTIIFVRTRQSACYLHTALVEEGYPVTTIHGALTQEDRDTIVKEFKDGLTHVLISTDLLARGFDQSQVILVVNYDLPVIHNSPSEPDNEYTCIGLVELGVLAARVRLIIGFNLDGLCPQVMVQWHKKNEKERKKERKFRRETEKTEEPQKTWRHLDQERLDRHRLITLRFDKKARRRMKAARARECKTENESSKIKRQEEKIARAREARKRPAVFNLLCGDTDDRIMAKIEHHFNHSIAEVPSWKSDEDFEDALKKAQLL